VAVEALSAAKRRLSMVQSTLPIIRANLRLARTELHIIHICKAETDGYNPIVACWDFRKN
jgi:hypothetical protein